MAELATLGIEVVSTPVDQATGKLQKFANAARIAEGSVQGIGSGTSAASKIAASALDGMASRMKAVEKVSRDAEKAMAAQSLAAQKLAASSKVVASAANQNVQQVTKLHDVSNLAAQGFDIVTTAAGGMSAGLIGMQQGLQIAQVAMASGGGFARSLGAAFVGMLSPVTLISVGLTTLAAVAIQSLTSWFSSSENVNLSLEKQNQLVASVAERWGAATPLIKAYADELERVRLTNEALGASDLVAKSKFADAQAAIASVATSYEQMIMSLNANPNNTKYADDIVASFQTLVQRFAEGKAATQDITNAQKALDEALKTGNPTVVSFGSAFAGIVGQLNSVATAMTNVRMEAARAVLAMDKVLNDPKTWRSAGRTGLSADGMIQGADSEFAELPMNGPTFGSRPSDLDTAKNRGYSKPKSAANDNYQNAIRSAQERTKAIQAETAAQAMLNPAVNDYGFAVAKARSEAELLAAAEREKKAITPELNAQIQQTATALASATAAQARLTDETKKAQEYTSFLKSTTAGFVNELRNGLRNGEGFWKSFGNAALSVLDRITDRLLNQVMDAIFQVNGAAGSSGGGGILGMIGGLFGGGSQWSQAASGKITGLFAEGGYTGNAAATQAAGIVHGGEYVFSKKATDRIGVKNLDGMHKRAKGYASGGHVTPVMPSAAPANQNAASGSQTGGQSVVRISLSPELLAQVLEQAQGQTIVIVKENNKAREELYRNGSAR